MRGRGINTDDSEFLNNSGENAETTQQQYHPNAICKLLFSSV